MDSRKPFPCPAAATLSPVAVDTSAATPATVAARSPDAVVMPAAGQIPVTTPDVAESNAGLMAAAP